MGKKLEELIPALEKKFHTGIVAKMSETLKLGMPCVSTGSIGLDLTLGGGIPYGSIVEIYGPEAGGKTTCCLSIIKEVLDANPNAKALFVDAEQKLNPRYCEDMGISLDRLYSTQPACGEDGFDLAEAALESDDVKIVVIDSVARMTPRAIIEDTADGSHMGLHARLMSRRLQRMVPRIKDDTIVIFVNQLREKIGVMFGCFSYDSRVLLEDGTTQPIGKIVNQKLPVRVMSYNEKTGVLEPKKIINYYNNGKYNQLYKVKVAYPHISGESKFTVADDHLFPTPNGELKLSELHVGDLVYGRSKTYLNDDQYQLCLGTVLGDGSLRKKDKQSHVVRLRMGHGHKQNAYCAWKKDRLPAEFIGSEYYSNKGELRWASKSTSELNHLYAYKANKCVSGLSSIIPSITLKSLAIWYLDDGSLGGQYKKWGGGRTSIAASCLTELDKTLLLARFEELGIDAPTVNDTGFEWYGKKSEKIQRLLAPYIPECMHYKLIPRFHSIEKYQWDESNNVKETVVPCRITCIEEKINYVKKSPFKFDIEVEDNHNYFVDNTLVHNSPEVTTGGNSLKYYCMVRLEVRSAKGDRLTDKEKHIYGQSLRVKVIKNQFGTPHGTAKFDFIYGESGFDTASELLDLGVDYAVLEKAGGWYSYNKEKLGNGKAACVQLLKDNPELYEEILAKVEKEIYGEDESEIS